MRLASLILISINISCVGCLKEPSFVDCVFYDVGLAHCFPINMGDAKEYKITSKDMIGWSCQSPDGKAELVKHHDELHKRQK